MVHKPWSGRFEGDTDKSVEEFTTSLSFDRRLARQDIAGSIAHARMLAKQGIITPEEGEQIVAGLNEILDEIEAGKFEFDPAREDIHMAIEARLTARLGEVGRKLHTARSRNDQVALDVRLYLAEATESLLADLRDLRRRVRLAHLRRRHRPVIPHMRRAQPILLSTSGL
jgi:argininosuccinate lyase